MRSMFLIFLSLGLATIALVLCLTLFVIWSTNSSIFYTPSATPHKQVALVLGASVHANGTLSTVLEERANKAIELYKMGAVSKILVSGDNSSVAHNEVYPVGKYLVSHGIPVSNIFLDYAGFDTYSSMYRAKNIFGVTSMIVTTQRFHLPRALYIARKLGIDAVGLDVSKPEDNYFTNGLREIPATSKAVFDLIIKRIPYYLGPTYFVTGDGTATWVGPKVEMIYFTHE